MINLIKKYLTHSYYRPLNILGSLLAYFLELFYTRKSQTFSEKTFIKKKIPNSISYYNFFGRMVYISVNFLSIIFFNKIFDKNVVLEENKTKKDSIKKQLI